MNSFIANILRTDYVEINNPVKWIGVEPYCQQTNPQTINCEVSAWSNWSACVNGFETRTRTVITPAQNGGIACPILTENRSCTIPVINPVKWIGVEPYCEQTDS
jgi:hypothetical protein